MFPFIILVPEGEILGAGQCTPMTPPAPSGIRRSRRGTFLLTLLVAALVAAAGMAVATLVVQQSFSVTPASHAPPVVFATGDDAATLVTQGWLSGPTITASGASASVTLYGVPGALSVSLGDVLELQNTESLGGTAYTVTLSTSSLPAGVSSIVLSFSDDVSGTPTARSWNLATTPTFTAYTLSPQEIWELSAVLVMPASGALSAITISASITPV